MGKLRHTSFMLISVLFILILAACSKGTEDFKETERRFKEYLKEKYSTEFEVNDVKYFQLYLGADKQLRGTANPVDQSDISFEIKKLVDQPEIYEDYLSVLWSNQADDIINQLGMKSYGEELPNRTKAIVKDEFERGFNGKPPQLEKALTELNEKLKFRLTYIVPVSSGSMSEEMKIQEGRKIIEFMKLVKNERFYNADLLVYFYERGRLDEAKQLATDYLMLDSGETLDLAEKGILKCKFYIEMDDIEQFNSNEELLSLYKDYEWAYSAGE